MALRGGGAKEQITAAFKAGGGPGALCPVVVNDKYPFTPGATNEATLEEFGKLFAPGGVLDAFFNTQLKPYVDTTVRPWKPQPVEGVAPPSRPADLQQFQRAAAIRDLFFAQRRHHAEAALRPDAAQHGPGATRMTLDLGSATPDLRGGGPPRPAQITWPPPQAGTGQADLGPAGAGQPGLAGARALGAVPPVRARQASQPAGGDRATLTFRDGDRSARVRAARGAESVHLDPAAGVPLPDAAIKFALDTRDVFAEHYGRVRRWRRRAIAMARAR